MENAAFTKHLGYCYCSRQFAHNIGASIVPTDTLHLAAGHLYVEAVRRVQFRAQCFRTDLCRIMKLVLLSEVTKYNKHEP